MLRAILLCAAFVIVASPVHAQGLQCRTSPNGASSTYCSSEAFVTQHFPGSATAGHIATFADNTGQKLADGGAFAALLTGTVLAKTTAYTALSSDCSDTITLGGASQYQLTLNAASGYAANCAFIIQNLATETKTKTIAINGLSSFDLYPGLTTVVENQNNTWVIIGGFPLQRWKITTTENWYWRPLDGSDTLCDGFTDAPAAGAVGRACAFASANKAASTIAQYIDINSAGGGLAVMQADCVKPCTITDGSKFPALVGITFVGGPVQITGDVSTPSNIKLVPSPSPAVSDGIQVTFPTGGGTINIGGFEIGGGANLSHGVYCSGGGQCNISGAMIFDAISSAPAAGWPAGCGITANAHAGVYLNATIFNTANIGAPLCITNSGYMENGGAITENTSNTPAWGSGFVFAAWGGSGSFGGMLFNGTGATGNRCSISAGANITVNNSGPATFFPGSVNCSVAAGTVDSTSGEQGFYK